MIAIPIQKSKEVWMVAPLLDKAKWFAFIKDNEIVIEEKKTYSPFALKHWLLEKDVAMLILRKITNLQYQIIKEENHIKLFYTGYAKIKMSDAINRYKNRQLTRIDNSNDSSIIHHF